jgi:rubrerythrin
MEDAMGTPEAMQDTMGDSMGDAMSDDSMDDAMSESMSDSMGMMELSTPLDVLNYALTLEHLEYAFYRDGLETYDADAFAAAGYAANVFDYFATIRDDEKAHVDTVTQVIIDLGGEPVAEGTYDFGYANLDGFINVAMALENTGVSAYQGAAQDLIGENELLTAALTIHGVEARHAAYLNGLTGGSPFPDAFNPTLTPDEVLAIAGPFIKM